MAIDLGEIADEAVGFKVPKLKEGEEAPLEVLTLKEFLEPYTPPTDPEMLYQKLQAVRSRNSEYMKKVEAMGAENEEFKEILTGVLSYLAMKDGALMTAIHLLYGKFVEPKYQQMESAEKPE